ncbi:hypothetical protein U9M48_042522 [Paspalum notatum var. saurae]|uniref:Reverse transcriptase domain-containing protein n=1 Tax=Paspalum notatum var. saurae TaxID=547442 RepID=A0AAQ3XFC6_PASNO
MRFQGMLQGQAILILVDSGSSHTFLSSKVADKVVGVSPLPVPIAVQVADGGRLPCGTHIKQAHWQLDECNFFTDMKILDLSYYDLIVGMDWLEAHSPMEVHWLQKWMIIPYQNASVLLQGLVPELPAGSVVEVAAITQEQPDLSVMVLHLELVQLLESYVDVFDKPTGLPPSRSCDHAILLVPGASPVRIRPYRYPPAVKDEIETQVVEMLKSGIIQHSQSAFSSPVLLVKKKDLSWRFCVDFRHLNAITIKTVYPVPIIEELLDELGQASWFTSLDLTAGYHQILLQPGEGPKTAFQTHSGHYEFRVMAFGLSGAPATFQKAMNSTLAPYLRKFVLVFFDDILIYSATREDHLHHIRLVLELLQKDQWKGVATDPSKISAVANWPTPTSVKELRSFLGLAGYYRRFVHHFGVIARPLNDLLKKGALFVWTSQHDGAFQALKEALITALVLALPNFSVPFCIETDASGVGVGAFLMQQVARVFHDQVYKHHGLPQAIVSDRDRIFLSRLWQQLFQLADVQLRMIAQLWYNSSPHSATGRAPFQLLYGYLPRHFGISDTSVVAPSDLDSWWTERQLMTDVIRQHLERAKIRMKKQADKGRSEREFQVGDWVFLKLQPYVQSSLAPRANQKLAFKFFGPYQILSRVGSVAYKLQLPASAAIHPVFHVSQLKRAVGSGFTASPILPDPSFEWSIPLKILGRRTVTRGRDSVPQVLVQWSQMPESLATWEDTQALKQQFPRAAVWGHPASQDGGNVSELAGPSATEEVIASGPGRARRNRSNNRNVFGPEWLNVLLAPSALSGI